MAVKKKRVGQTVAKTRSSGMAMYLEFRDLNQDLSKLNGYWLAKEPTAAVAVTHHTASIYCIVLFVYTELCSYNKNNIVIIKHGPQTHSTHPPHGPHSPRSAKWFPVDQVPVLVPVASAACG